MSVERGTVVIPEKAEGSVGRHPSLQILERLLYRPGKSRIRVDSVRFMQLKYDIPLSFTDLRVYIAGRGFLDFTHADCRLQTTVNRDVP